MSNHKEWVFARQDELIEASLSLNSLTTSLSSLLTNLDNFNKKIIFVEQKIKKDKKTDNKKKGRMGRLLKLNFKDLVQSQEKNQDLKAALYSPMGASTEFSFRNPTLSKTSSVMKSITDMDLEEAENTIKELNELSSDDSELKETSSPKPKNISQLLDELEINILEQKILEGMELIAELESRFENKPKHFTSFALIGKYKQLKIIFCSSLGDQLEKDSLKEGLKKVKRIQDIGLYSQANQLFFKVFSASMEKMRVEFLEHSLLNQKFIKNWGKIPKFFAAVFNTLLGAIELLKSEFLFGRNQELNPRFGGWAVKQIEICLNEIFSRLGDSVLCNKLEMMRLKSSLEIEFGEYESKGLSLIFVLEEFYEGIEFNLIENTPEENQEENRIDLFEVKDEPVEQIRNSDGEGSKLGEEGSEIELDLGSDDYKDLVVPEEEEIELELDF